MSSPRPQSHAPPVPSAGGCLIPLLGAVCGAIAVGWWRYEVPPERPAFSQFDQTPPAILWLAFWVWVGATAGFVVGVVVAKCASSLRARK